MERALRDGLAAHQFVLYCQPQFGCQGGLLGAEVLLRWHDSELGSVEPSRFIPVAEESGMIVPLGDWVLAQAMALLAEWQREGLDHLRLAVNLSARQFMHRGLVDSIRAIVAV